MRVNWGISLDCFSLLYNLVKGTLPKYTQILFCIFPWPLQLAGDLIRIIQLMQLIFGLLISFHHIYRRLIYAVLESFASSWIESQLQLLIRLTQHLIITLTLLFIHLLRDLKLSI